MKRYTGAIDFYIWADSDENAREILQEICDKMKAEKDNQANPIALHSTPFGKLEAKKINHN